MKMHEEIEKTAQALAKSSAIDNFSPELLKSTIKDLGVAGLKAVIPTLNDAQKALLKSVLAEMQLAKASNALATDEKSKDINPERKQVEYTSPDEKMVAEAKKKGMDEVKHQGDDTVLAGQVVKADGCFDMSDKMAEKMAEKMHEKNETKAEEKKEHKKEEVVEKAEGSDYSPEGSRIEKNPTNGTKRESEAPQSTDEKKESEKEPIMSIEDKKAAAKGNLHKMLKRMQERGMEKSKCISVLAKSLAVDESKLAPIWDLVKACECSNCATPEKAQVKPAPIMTEEKAPAKKEPMSGHAHETADEGEQAPAVKKSTVETVEEVGKEGKKGGKVIGHREEGGMPVYASERETKEEKGEESKEKDVKKSDNFFYEDESFYTPSKTENPFNHRTHGQNVTYSVDAFIDEASNAQSKALTKSSFLYHSSSNAKPAKSIDEMIAAGTDRDCLIEDVEVITIQKSNAMLVKSFDDKDLDSEIDGVDMWGVPMRKSAAGKEAVVAQVEANAKAQAENKKKENQDLRDAKVDEKLTRIEERAGHSLVSHKDV